ncbi:Smr domain-containing protein [Alkalispirochaeta americana]|uniref:Smr domain-containing protein n=1 Tax=Alkalispirochaeta americana TaxID=159291 RepID=A0A1N6UFG0_9SPIO|nr:Smr/MutS family protein [Alkalispirochaeta americana]SIQ64297.1 Smr domain-containing protein [Alkalispirochaeta americana]
MKPDPMELYLQRYPPCASATGMKDMDEEEDLRQRLAPRRLPVERTLDLHGMTQEEARLSLGRFLATARAEGIRKVLIIHGKGTHGETGGVLRRLVQGYLEADRSVGATGTPSAQEGGTGATWAIVRQRSR